jgi:predicted MFS family arabinose efflux permease
VATALSFRSFGRATPLGRDPMRRYTIASALTAFGGAVNAVAIPLVGMFSATLSSFELGVLVSIEQIAWLMVGLPAGVWIDRWQRRRVVVLAQMGRAVLIATIPVMVLFGRLSFWTLAVVGLAVGFCEVFGGIAQAALVPEIVPADRLVDANSRINAMQTATSLSGSATVGPIISLLGAPTALLLDSLACLSSSGLIRTIKVETRLIRHRSSFRRELLDGIRLIAREPLFRTLTISGILFNGFMAAQYVLCFVFLRDLGVGRSWFGLLLAASGLGALCGSLLVTRLLRRRRDASIWRFFLVAGPAVGLLIPMASQGWGVTFYILGSFGMSCAVAVSSIIGFTARQTACSAEMLGRTNSAVRVLTWGIIPIGASLGGWVGDLAGSRSALWIVAALFFLEPLIVRCTGLWRWQEFSKPAPDL